MSNQDDIAALLRIVREQQGIIDDLKDQLDKAERDASRYHEWWQEDAIKRQNLEDEIKLWDEKETR